MFRSFATWLSNTALSTLLAQHEWIVPTSQSIHIVCIGIVFASAIMINMKVLGLTHAGRTVSQLSNTVIPWMWGALLLLLFTGMIQTIAEPVRQFVTPVFWAKMIMVLIVTIMTALFARAVRSHAAQWDSARGRPRGAKQFAVVSSVLWIAIIVCGRFIGYTSALYL